MIAMKPATANIHTSAAPVRYAIEFIGLGKDGHYHSPIFSANRNYQRLYPSKPNMAVLTDDRDGIMEYSLRAPTFNLDSS